MRPNTILSHFVSENSSEFRTDLFSTVEKNDEQSWGNASEGTCGDSLRYDAPVEDIGLQNSRENDAQMDLSRMSLANHPLWVGDPFCVFYLPLCAFKRALPLLCFICHFLLLSEFSFSRYMSKSSFLCV